MTRRRRKSKRADPKSNRPPANTVEDPLQTERTFLTLAKQWKWPLAAVIGVVCVSVIAKSNQLEMKKLPPADNHRSTLAAGPASADPANVEAHYKLGRTLQSQGKLDEAIAHYRQAIAIRSDDARVHNNLAAALAGQKKYEEAIKHLRRALALEPDNIEAKFNLGNASFSTGKIDDAIRLFREVLAAKPSYAKAHNNLAVALKQAGLLQEAYKHRYEAMRLERAQQGSAESP